jgi:hypothetical protein
MPGSILMKEILIGVVAVLICASGAWADDAPVTESDFYCLPVPFGKPSQFDKSEKTCTDQSGTKNEKIENVCTEGARCIFLDSEMKKTKVNGVALGKISEAAKLAYFQKIYKEDYDRERPLNQGPGMADRWLQADLICKKNGEDCPLPEQCKGDLLYKPVSADYDSFTIKKPPGKSHYLCLPASSNPNSIGEEIPPAIFAKQVKTCTDEAGKITEVRDEVCSELASCTFIDENINNLVISKTGNGSAVTLGDLPTDEQKAVFRDSLYKHSPELGDRWKVSNFFCPKNSVSGKCPQPQDCKGDDDLWLWRSADYAHPAVNNLVDAANEGKTPPVQHQGSGNAAGPNP